MYHYPDVIVGFDYHIQRLTRSIVGSEILPTIDVDMLVSQIVDYVHESNYYALLANLTDRLLASDWLFDDPEWRSVEEETEIKWYLKNVILECGMGMHQHLKELKMIQSGTTYHYKKAISSHAFLFQAR